MTAVDARRLTARALGALAEPLAHGPIRVVAAGKAAAGMAAAVAEALGSRVVAGLATVATAVEELDATSTSPRWVTIAGSHPHPARDSARAGRAALGLADDTAESSGTLLVCLSGGASAMLAAPAGRLTIEDKAAAARLLQSAGLEIGDVNLVRRHLSAIKGGRLAARAGRTVCLALSDVSFPVEDDPIVIGSGPTVGDPTTFADALAVIARAGVADRLPPAVMTHLEDGAAGREPECVRPGDPRLAQSSYWIVGSRHEAMAAAAATARRIGYGALVHRGAIHGQARDAWRAVLAGARGLERPACIVASGETTVAVETPAHGGRNQETAVAALEAIAELGPAALASIGTDGVDGPTDAAGAIVDSTLWASLDAGERAAASRALETHETYAFLDAHRSLVRTGPTGTNVGDLLVMVLS